MTERSRRILSMALTLGLLGLNLAALNVLISGWSTARIDLTEDGEFSISEATERILRSLDDDLIIHGYFSKRTHPKLAPLVPKIVDLLDEYRAVAGGRVKVEIVDPGEDEEAERQANERFGIRSTPFRMASKYEAGIVNAYFALVVQFGDQYEKYGFDELIKVEPMPDGDIDVKLRNLEYDLTRAIKKVVYGFRNTAELFSRVEGGVQFISIMTPDTLPEIFQDVPEAVRGAVKELEEASDGKFTYEEIVPADDQMKEQVARTYGARPMSLGFFGGDPFYLYGLLRVGDQFEQIPLTEGEITQADLREAVEASVRRATPGFLKTVGVVAPSAEIPPEVLMQYQMQGMRPPTPPPEFQQVKLYLGQDYNVRELTLDDAVPADIDILLVLKPKNLPEDAVFNLDQYLMRGGRVLLAAAGFEAQIGQGGLRVSPVNTGLDDWLGHFGIKIAPEMVLDDQNRPLPIPERRNTILGQIVTWRMAPYPYLVEVRDDGLMAPEILAGLDSVGIYWGSPLELTVPEEGGIEVRELLKSSEKSWTSNDVNQAAFLDYEVPEETSPKVLAAALQGRFQSYFHDKDAPAAMAPAEGEEPQPPPVVLKESPETRLLVVGDTEFLSDFVARALGDTEGGFFEQNLRFVENAIDWMTLDNDMIGIRSRGASTRRLDSTERATEVTVEAVNYVIPAAVLILFGALHMVKRRKTRSILGSVAASGSMTAAGEV